MKRDMDLVRALLLAVEEKGDEDGRLYINVGSDREKLGLADYSPFAISYHIGLLGQAGFIEVSPLLSAEGYGEFDIERMTWDGHEFLDNVRDAKIWRLTKEGAKKAGSASVGLLAELAKGYAKQMAQQMGLPIP